MILSIFSNPRISSTPCGLGLSFLENASLDDLFNHKNYLVVEAEHMIENTRSAQVMIKCGFRFNYKTDVLTEKHGWISVKHYSITKEEYLMHKLQKLLNNFLNVNLFNSKV